MRKSENRRILVVGQLPPPVHGSNVMAAIFLESLRKLGYAVRLAKKKFSSTTAEVERFRPKKLIKVPLIAVDLVISVVRHRPSLCFYFNMVTPMGFLLDAFYLSILRIFGVNYVLYIHGKGLSRLSQGGVPGLGWVVRRTLSRALGAIVLGEKLKQDVTGLIPNNRLFTLPNAIADVSHPEGQKRVRDGRNVQVLYLSNLVPAKGPVEFLEMARMVSKVEPEVNFILAGPALSSEYLRQLHDYIQNSGLSDRVHMPGGVYGDQKAQLLESSDIFTFPTAYPAEAFPLVCLEAMQRGLPVIASPEGGIPEMIRDGLNGFIVDPKDIESLSDRVIRMVRDEELRKRMGAEGRRIYENEYSIQAYERNLKNCLRYFFELQDRS